MKVKIEHLKVSLQEQEILDDISFQIEDGEFLSLLGASGCGKSTLLKSIAGLLEVTSGDIRNGQGSLLQIPPEKRGTVIVFQDLRLFPHMTVEKNIAFPMELQKIPKSEQKEIIEKLLAEVQLEGFGKRKIRELSGGQMQRVALARALAADPKVLLLDEPFSGLDEQLRLEMGRMVRRLHKERKITTILVTHDKREALQMSDRIILMKDGRILQCDTPKEIFYHPVTKEVAEYFGKVNYIQGKVKNGHLLTPIFETETSWPDGAYELLLRPFSIQLKAEGSYLIQDMVFMGELAEVVVETPAGKLICQVMDRKLEALGVCVGKTVGLEINSSEIICINQQEKRGNERDEENNF